MEERRTRCNGVGPFNHTIPQTSRPFLFFSNAPLVSTFPIFLLLLLLLPLIISNVSKRRKEKENEALTFFFVLVLFLFPLSSFLFPSPLPPPPKPPLLCSHVNGFFLSFLRHGGGGGVNAYPGSYFSFCR